MPPMAAMGPPAPPSMPGRAPPEAIADCMFSAIALNEGSSEICFAISLIDGSSSISLILLMSKGAPGGMPPGMPPRPPKPGGRSPAPVVSRGREWGEEGVSGGGFFVTLNLKKSRKGDRVARSRRRESRAVRARRLRPGRGGEGNARGRGRTSHFVWLRVLGVWVSRGCPEECARSAFRYRQDNREPLIGPFLRSDQVPFTRHFLS